MSLKVLELNDSAVTVSDHSGIITQSPGFALLAPGGLEVGEAAEKQARLNPTGSFNKFWSQLSLEPLGHSSGKARHFADLAYAHLMHVAEAGQLQDEVILAVPGNFTNQQLAILLGLVGSCPFQPLGIVDSALAGALDISDGRPLVYADIQLHQVLLTRFVTVDGHLQREKVAQIPEIGLQNFSNLIMQLATGLFIQQCRFNPQHDAHSEQQMYNQLPNWLQKGRGNRSSLLMEIKTGDGVHEAKLPWESLVQKLNEYYSRINQQLSALMGGEPVQLAVSSALAELPDFTQSLTVDAEPIIVTQDRIGRNCLAMAAQIDSRDSGFRCISRLPLAGAVTASSDESRNETGGVENATADKAAPTHVLYGDQAIPLGHIRLKNTPEGQLGRVNGSGIVMALKDLPAQLGEINLEDGQVYLDSPVSETLVNGEVISGRHPLELGDRISYGAPDHEIQLIRVSDGKQ